MTTPARLTATTPESVGIDSAKLEALYARVRRDVEDGTLPSASVAVVRQGKLAGFKVFGKLKQADGTEAPATEDTLYTIFSSTKGIVSAAVWKLIEDGLLRIEEKVADVVPEFATNGKEGVTVEQAFLHIGGFPLAPLGPRNWGTREGRLEAFAKWRLTFEPGSKFEYHASSLHWLLCEMIERRSGVPYRQYLWERIVEPIGLEQFYLGLPPELNSRVADVFHVVPPTPPPGGWGEVTPDAILNFNKPEMRAVGMPGGGGIGRAAELALFYGALANGGVTGDGKRVLKAETIAYATEVRTDGRHVDAIFGKPINRALGVVVAGSGLDMAYRGFGTAVSARAFGHGGAGGQIAWGDPETGIALGYCTQGFVDDETMRTRTREVGTLAAQCAM